jgi:lipoprotein-anchoring transpeptidase ErfK/SrfK
MPHFKKLTLLKAIIILLVVSVVAGFAYAVYDDASHHNQIMPGAKIAGISVGGYDKAEAKTIIKRELTDPLLQPVMLVYKSHTWKLPTEAVVAIDTEEMVGEAYRFGWKKGFFERTYHRWFKNPIEINIPLKLTIDKKKINNYLVELAKEINAEPVDARLDVSTRVVKIVPSEKGRKLSISTTQSEIEKILPISNRKVTLPVEVIPPKKTEDDFDTVILIKQQDHTLSLYHREELKKIYGVAVGMPQYPTPTGSFKVVRKRTNPTWYNPRSEWAKEMPDFIPPGPDNPLGSRAMDLNTPGIRIHGTPNEASIGHSASHGCIRMKMAEAEDLFNRVKVETPVEIIW